MGPADRELINGGLTAASAFKGTLDKKWEGGIIPFVFDRWFGKSLLLLFDFVILWRKKM